MFDFCLTLCSAKNIIKYGFKLIGLTTTEYDNKEEFKGEVRFEMGYNLD